VKRILVAVDGSEHSRRVAKYAANLAAQLSAQLTLAHGVEVLQRWGSEALVPYEAFDREQERAARELVRNLSQELEPFKVQVETRVVKGPPAQAIAELAKREGFDCIVVGSRSESAFARLLLGSFAHRLVHISDTPVLLVR
jgi:nucleotide-binding universal stress UspA family protein